MGVRDAITRCGRASTAASRAAMKRRPSETGLPEEVRITRQTTNGWRLGGGERLIRIPRRALRGVVRRGTPDDDPLLNQGGSWR